MDLQGSKSFFVLWFGLWVLEGAAGTCCFCLGCCEKQLKHSTGRAGLVLQREGGEANGDNDKQCWGLHSCLGPLTGKDFTDCSNNLCIAVTITDKSCASFSNEIQMLFPFSSSRRLPA